MQNHAKLDQPKLFYTTLQISRAIHGYKRLKSYVTCSMGQSKIQRCISVGRLNDGSLAKVDARPKQDKRKYSYVNEMNNFLNKDKCFLSFLQ